MNLINPNQKMSFDGTIGSLGDGLSQVVSSGSIECKGGEERFLERCRLRFRGQEVLEDSMERNKNGVLVYHFRVRGRSGI